MMTWSRTQCSLANRATTVTDAWPRITPRRFHVMPKSARSNSPVAVSVRIWSDASVTAAVSRSGRVIPAAVRLPVTSALPVPALVAASMSMTICGWASALKKSADRRCLSRVPCLVSSDAASMTSCPRPDPSAAISPVPASREKLPRTVGAAC